jgi:4-alpha-glucanotransferase
MAGTIPRMKNPTRAAGVLLHPTSLPGPFGIGELGPEAFRFVRFLEEAGQKLWQMLPLGPTGHDGSPYSAYSAFAGNPLLVSTDRLVEDGLLRSAPAPLPPGPVAYRAVEAHKTKTLREAYASADLRGEDFERFREREEGWLEDYALYAALKGRLGGKPWVRWDEGLAKRDAGELARARRELEGEVCYHEYVQRLFFAHYGAVKAAANAAGVEVVGDLPIFVAHDSADVWVNQELFRLDERGEPEVVAGVPPDYFSETGQLWGNPLYRWDRIEETGYAWWTSRLQQALSLYDTIRIDHFRGFEAYWEVPAEAETAKEGQWVKGPGDKPFEAVRGALGDLPFVAEDLGEITPEVDALRSRLNLPGMKVLQFAFSSPDNPHLPHNFPDANTVVYTGTHDNDTTTGWWNSAPKEEKRIARRYLGKRNVSAWDLIRLAHASVAARAVVPAQDLLSLASETRMNTPGTAKGNWTWRLEEGALTPDLAAKLRDLTKLYNR